MLPGGGDGLTQLGYIQRNGNTYLVADTDDDGRLDADDFTVEFRGRLDFTPDDFDSTDFIIAGTNGDDDITGTEDADRIFAAGGNDRSSLWAATTRYTAAPATTSSREARAASTICSARRATTS